MCVEAYTGYPPLGRFTVRDMRRTLTVIKTSTKAGKKIDDELQNRWFDFGGNTVINTNHHIRLTSTKQSQLGYLWSRMHHSFPYVMAMLGDGMQSYDNDQDGRPTELTGCEADFRKKGFPTRSRLTYHKDNYLLLELIWRNEGEWETCFKQPRVRIPENVYLGMSAHTGQVTDNHDIISVVTRVLQPAVIEEVPLPEKKKAVKPNGGSVLSVLFKMVLAAGILGALFMGYRFYDQRNRMKRF
ncbi:concanavalin A-like lectin/glucanase [Backusella circina FSU 941]|nr:concanavalin A-like lectin/glucanase [Backusella circina FSU 941]